MGVGQMRAIEFVADTPGDWAFHCHKTHHTMNAMGHEVMTSIGVDFEEAAEKLRRLIPQYMVMGDRGMAEMATMQMELPENTLPMMTGEGPYGPIGMGGMFTVVKVRADQLPGDYGDPGWYEPPPGSMAYRSETVRFHVIHGNTPLLAGQNPRRRRTARRAAPDHRHAPLCYRGHEASRHQHPGIARLRAHQCESGRPLAT